MRPASPKFSAPSSDAAVPASLPWEASARICTAGNEKPQAMMNRNSGTIVPQRPAPVRSSTAIATAEPSSTSVVTARIHCGCTRPRMSRELVCTPMMMPTEFTPKSSPYCCAVKPCTSWNRNEDVER